MCFSDKAFQDFFDGCLRVKYRNVFLRTKPVRRILGIKVDRLYRTFLCFSDFIVVTIVFSDPIILFQKRYRHGTPFVDVIFRFCY